MTPLWVRDLANEFWCDAGGTTPFPRSILAALYVALDVKINEVHRLSIHKVENQLTQLGIPHRFGEPDRALRACVAAQGTASWIFLDADDPEDEKNASLVHEAAHVLRHCLQPRRRAVRELGAPIVSVLDARREPTPAERLRALLRGVSLDIHVHYLRRDGGICPPTERLAEEEADLLAWHLLAPAEEVLARLGDRRDPARARRLLIREFGLSPTMADDYAGWLCQGADDGPVVRRLEKVWRSRRTSDSARE